VTIGRERPRPGADLERRSTRGAEALLRTGADIVALSEHFYRQAFTAVIVLLAGSVPLALMLMPVRDGRRQPLLTTALIAVVLVAVLVLWRWRSRAYRILRRQPTVDLLLAASVGLLVVLDGPFASPLWYTAAAFLALVGVAAGARLAVTCAGLVACVYVVGAHLREEPLIRDGNVRALTEVLGLPIWAAASSALVASCAGFVLRLHRAERAAPTVAEADRRGAASTGAVALLPAPRRTTVRLDGTTTDAVGLALTPRQLQVVALLHDGLKQADIARALGITQRQVERLVRHARERARASTTTELLALAVAAGLVPVGARPNRHQ